MNTEQSLRRFGPQFVAEQRHRYGKRPPENRMLSYDLAVLDEYEPWRIWLDEQLALLPEAPICRLTCCACLHASRTRRWRTSWAFTTPILRRRS
ncbi:hypothetical protein [Streptomyces vietnamensis]|uniref:hypothetical protein n=1 Tax=Streptomyces vietnamensis TaxID=362257 RepID=UPI000A9B1B0E|nr:hypothetical protein [Streptomyces vietnamensis]